MEALTTLPYAPTPRRSRRLLKRIGLIVTIIGMGLWIQFSIWPRLQVLMYDPAVGPVDWWAVVRSPTLMRMAWTLSSNPKKANDPKIYGVYKNAVDVDVKWPLEFSDGCVCINLQITNRESQSIVVPSFSAGGSIPREVGCMLHNILAVPGCLQPGVKVLAPGTDMIVPLRFPADRRPASAVFQAFFPHGAYTFIIHAGGGRGGQYPYKNWADVPRTALRREKSALFVR